MNEATSTTSEAQAAAEGEPEQQALVEEMPPAIRVSEALRKFVDRVGRFGSWMIIPLVLITVFDVILRKIGANDRTDAAVRAIKLGLVK